MEKFVKIVIVPKIPGTIISFETGQKIGGYSFGDSYVYNGRSGDLQFDVVNARDIIPGVATSWSVTNPSNYAFSLTFPPQGIGYFGYDTDRGLLFGLRAESNGTGAYADIGLKTENSSGSWVDSVTYAVRSDGTSVQIGNVTGLPGGGNVSTYQDSVDGKLKVSNQPYMFPLASSLGPQWAPKCFVAGTEIQISDSETDLIENIKIGQSVLAFDNTANGGRGSLKSSIVTQIFQNETQQVIDLRGLFCTPGHAFLTDELGENGTGNFKTISSLLKGDGTIVDKDGVVIRARTGAPVNSVGDIQIQVMTFDVRTRHEGSIRVRAGIPAVMEHRILESGKTEVRTWSLAEWAYEQGVDVLPDGTFRTADGGIFKAIDWPLGSMPLDTHEMQNWVVTGPDGQPYTPPWIADLSEEDERASLRVVGEMPSMGFSAV